MFHFLSPLSHSFNPLIYSFTHAVTPVLLAGQLAIALTPQESFAKARLLCRLVAMRITPRTVNGETFVRTLSFFFAKRILGQEIGTSDVLPTGPSLEQIRIALVNIPRPTPENADLYWVVRCAVILLENAIKYHIRGASAELRTPHPNSL
jgi:hypothetical protein